MELEDLELVLRVMDAGSFRRAALALGLDPSVVSRRVAALEARLGVRLIHRTTRAVAPTEEGRAWAERVRPALASLREAERELQSGDTPSGTVRLAVPGAVGRRRVAPVLFQLLAQHPSLRFDLLVSDRRLNLVEEAIDLAIRVGSPPDSTFVARRIGLSPQVFAASPAYLARWPLPPASDLVRLVVRIEGGAPQDLSRLGTLWPPGTTLLPTLATDDVETAALAVAEGLGLGLLPEWLVADALAQGRLVRLLPEVLLPPAPLVAWLPAGRQSPRRVRLVLDALTAAFGG